MLNGRVKYWRHETKRDDDADVHLKDQDFAFLTRPPRPLAWLYYSFALAPALAFVTVWAFSWRVATIIGRWPLVMHDDPKFVAPNDLLSTVLHYAVFACILWSVVGVCILPMLTLLLRRVYSPWRLAIVLLFFAATFALMRMDPGLRFTWFAD